ncbi:hypothetical protein ACFQH2_12775 [Natronoarchaeum sp. GCM10025703]|uniref:hypothetical protein n=1 Tax=Natronoarchaeum sp. GCM10025703 TaxID=3252685 RepID=UPI00361C580E
MSERTDQLSKSRDSEVDTGSFDESLLDDSTERREPDPPAESSDGSRLAEYFAPKIFLVVFALLAVLGQLGSTFVPLVGGPLGVFVGAFAVGQPAVVVATGSRSSPAASSVRSAS